jgi:hypothetical protein
MEHIIQHDVAMTIHVPSGKWQQVKRYVLNDTMKHTSVTGARDTKSGMVNSFCIYLYVNIHSYFTRWTNGVLWFDSPRGLEIYLFITASRPALGPTQLPMQWVTGALSLRVKRPGREADTSMQCRDQRMRGAIPSLPNTPSWRGAQLSRGITLPLLFKVG